MKKLAVIGIVGLAAYLLAKKAQGSIKLPMPILPDGTIPLPSALTLPLLDPKGKATPLPSNLKISFPAVVNSHFDEVISAWKRYQVEHPRDQYYFFGMSNIYGLLPNQGDPALAKIADLPITASAYIEPNKRVWTRISINLRLQGEGKGEGRRVYYKEWPTHESGPVQIFDIGRIEFPLLTPEDTGKQIEVRGTSSLIGLTNGGTAIESIIAPGGDWHLVASIELEEGSADPDDGRSNHRLAGQFDLGKIEII